MVEVDSQLLGDQGKCREQGQDRRADFSPVPSPLTVKAGLAQRGNPPHRPRPPRCKCPLRRRLSTWCSELLPGLLFLQVSHPKIINIPKGHILGGKLCSPSLLTTQLGFVQLWFSPWAQWAPEKHNECIPPHWGEHNPVGG